MHAHFLFRMFFTCSTDKTVAVWDTEVGVRIRKLRGHQTFVNSVCPTRRGPQYLCSGSDDGTVKVQTDVVKIVYVGHSVYDR